MVILTSGAMVRVTPLKLSGINRDFDVGDYDETLSVGGIVGVRRRAKRRDVFLYLLAFCLAFMVLCQRGGARDGRRWRGGGGAGKLSLVCGDGAHHAHNGAVTRMQGGEVPGWRRTRRWRR